MKNREELFENVLAIGHEYIELLDSGSSAEAQEKALAKWNEAFGFVIEANLCSEYNVYCDTKFAKARHARVC